MSIIKINQKLKRVEFNSFEMDNEIVFEYFNKQPADKRDKLLIQALYIGCLALIEDRLSSFLAKTTNELGTELEKLKIMFDFKKEIFFKTSVKGAVAETEIATALTDYMKKNGLKDELALTGEQEGHIKKNKTGDIVVSINENNFSTSVGIECKFDKSIKLGNIEDKGLSANKYDTAWGQLLETNANRGTDISIIVFDKSLVDPTIERFVDNIKYIPNIGFISIIDSQRSDYTNLFVAYDLARTLAMTHKKLTYDSGLLEMLIKKIIKDSNSTLNVRKMILTCIQTNKDILVELDKNLYSLEFSKKYLEKFLKYGDLSKEDLLDFYNENDVRDKLKELKSEIDSL